MTVTSSLRGVVCLREPCKPNPLGAGGSEQLRVVQIDHSPSYDVVLNHTQVSIIDLMLCVQLVLMEHSEVGKVIE